MNTNKKSRSAQEERLERAAQWWLRLREPDVSPDVIVQWMLWCEASPDNRGAFDSVQSLWQKSKFAPLEPVSEAELRRDDVPRRLLPWAIAATVVVASVLLIAVPWSKQHGDLPTQNGAAVSTKVGANREVILPDGSRAILGGATALTVAYTADRRTVALNSGEAFFQVRPDMSRPFIVQTPTGTAAAVGTAFDVRTDGGILRVTVSEGVVEVAASEQSARVQGSMGAAPTAESGTHAGPLRIRAGEQAVLRPNAPVVTGTQDPHVVTAWTTGTLKFIDEPFDSVIAAVNRYSATRIELRGEGPSHLRYTGTVVSGRAGEWLAALPNVFPVEVVSQDSDRIIIRSRE